jgi:hypothetical protein
MSAIVAAVVADDYYRRHHKKHQPDQSLTEPNWPFILILMSPFIGIITVFFICLLLS